MDSLGHTTADVVVRPLYAIAEELPEPGTGLVGLNSHDYGIEQIFIRTHIDDIDPWREITITSYERIVDIVKYRVPIPEPLRAELKACAMEYVSPLYRTYRDDNLR